MGRRKKNLDDATTNIIKTDEVVNNDEAVVKTDKVTVEETKQVIDDDPLEKSSIDMELDLLIRVNQRLEKLLHKSTENDAQLLDSMSSEQKMLLSKQYMMQNKLIHLLKRRVSVLK